MAKKKRRRPAAPARSSRRANPAATAAASAPPATPAAEAPKTGRRPAAPTRPGRGARPRLTTSALDEPTRWSRLALLTLLALTFAAQLVVGAITHAIGHRDRLLIVDLLFFQAPFVLAACVVLMPLASRLTHQPRMLRLLEALSLGAVYAMFSLLLTTVFVHPAVDPRLTADQVIDRLSVSDALGIGVADVLAMLVCVQIFPSLQRLLTAPGRKARQRLVARREAASAAAPRRPGKEDRERR